MQHDITTMEDVKAFIAQIAGEIDDFHLLTDFNDYVRSHSFFRRYTEEEAAQRNKALDQCIHVCEKHTEDCFTYLEWYYNLMRVQMPASTQYS